MPRSVLIKPLDYLTVSVSIDNAIVDLITIVIVGGDGGSEPKFHFGKLGRWRSIDSPIRMDGSRSILIRAP